MSGPYSAGDDGIDSDGYVTDERADEMCDEAFTEGARACREMLARFVEQGGHPGIAMSIRANWHPGWGVDPGPITGLIPLNPGEAPSPVSCHCVETWPQLSPGKIIHGPGCPRR